LPLDIQALQLFHYILFVKTYHLLAVRVNTFNTAASLYKWSAVLVIVFIGVILWFIAKIVAIVAFFTLKERAINE